MNEPFRNLDTGLLSPQERNAMKHYVSTAITFHESTVAKHKADFVAGIVYIIISASFALFGIKLGAIVFFVFAAIKLLLHLYLEKTYIPSINAEISQDIAFLEKLNGS